MKIRNLKIGVLYSIPTAASLLLPQIAFAESGSVGDGQFWFGVVSIIVTLLVAFIGIAVTFLLSFNKLSDRVSKIEGILEIISKGLNISLTQSQSPLSLSEEGEKVLVDSGGKEYIEKKSSDLITALSEKVEGDFSNPFDVQEKAKEVISDIVTKTGEMSDIKHYLYEHSRKNR